MIKQEDIIADLHTHTIFSKHAYNTIMGPLKFNVHYSNLTNKVGAYVSFGYDF